MAIEAGSVIGGKYRLFKPLARGGMGAIWVARHTELDVSVAIKVIAPDMVLSQTALTRFRHEARAAAQLRSPHVVQILDYGVEDGVPYMAMELLVGEDLGDRLERGGRLALPQVVEILTGVSKALKLAHEARIVHRDLKPGNIYLARIGDDEVVKVLDFGIAKALTPEGGHAQTASATLVGSPLYMSPEQSRGDAVDARSDLWSLAVVAYEILAARPPFEGRGLGDLFGQICHGQAPPISSLGVHALGLDAFFERALAKDPNERFQSMGEWITALRACSGERGSLVSLPEAHPVPSTASQERSTPRAAEALTTAASGTNAGISSEINLPGRGAKKTVVRLAIGLALVAGAGASAFALLGNREGGTQGARPEATALGVSVSAEPDAKTTPDGIDVVPTAVATASEAALGSAPAPTASVLSPGSQGSAPEIAQPTGPRPIATSKPTAKPTAKPTVKPVATTDDIFGIPGQ